MKDHFSKQLTEKARCNQNPSVKWGKRLKLNADPEYDYEDEITRAPMARRSWAHRGDYKSLSDVLGPLKSYLKHSVGQPWDDIYSELCANLDRRSVSGLHVFQHLWHYVENNCYIGVDGKVYTEKGYGPRRVGHGDFDFYVHPWTGLLSQLPLKESWRKHYARKRAQLPVTELSLVDGNKCQLIKGIWYFIVYTKRIEYSALSGKHYEVVEQKHFQLNKKELKKLKLKNSPR